MSGFIILRDGIFEHSNLEFVSNFVLRFSDLSTFGVVLNLERKNMRGYADDPACSFHQDHAHGTDALSFSDNA